MTKKRPPKPRKRKQRQETDTGTPETRRRLKSDPVLEMISKGLLDTAQERAASEIREVYLAITRGLWPKIVNAEIHGKGSEIPDALASAYSVRYRVWVQDTHREVVDATLRLVVEKEGPGSDLGERLIAGALRQYARLF